MSIGEKTSNDVRKKLKKQGLNIEKNEYDYIKPLQILYKNIFHK